MNIQQYTLEYIQEHSSTIWKKLQTTGYRKNRNGNQLNDMENNFSRHQKRKLQPAKVWITQFGEYKIPKIEKSPTKSTERKHKKDKSVR